MQCIYKKYRTKKYQKFYYCSHETKKRKIDLSECSYCNEKEYKKAKNTYQKKYKKHRRTIATSISTKTKEEVRKRDKGLCVICLFFRN